MLTLNRIDRVVTALCRFGTGVSFSVLIVAVLIQVIGRTIGSSPVWTEELTRFALLYTAAFGVGLALRSGDLVNVDMVCEALPGRLPFALRMMAAATSIGLCAVLLPSAWKYVSIGRMQTSPAIGVPMNYVHFSVFLLLLLLLVFAALRIAGMLTGREDGTAIRSIEED